MSADEKASEAGAFAKEVKATFPVVHDVDSKVFEKFGVLAVPANVVIDRKGKVVFTQEGAAIKPLEAALAREVARK